MAYLKEWKKQWDGPCFSYEYHFWVHQYRDPGLMNMSRRLYEDILALAGVSGSNLGTGGMITKLQAAKICMSCGCAMVIANGKNPENLYDILDGKQVGTTFSER